MRPASYSLQSIPSGGAGTVATLAVMRRLVRQAMQRPEVVEAAHDVVRGVPERDDLATMRALLAEVRRRMRYTRDPLDVELVKAPWVVLTRTSLSGEPEPMDCDDAATLLASLLGAVGIPTRFVVVATDASRPREFSHVYVAGRTSTGQWVPLDPIVRGWDAGTEVPEAALTRPRAYMQVAGLGRYNDMEDRLDLGAQDRSPTDVEAISGSVERTLDRLLQAKYGLRPRRQYGQQYPTGPTIGTGTGVNWREWLDPFYTPGLNWKALLVWGGIAFLGWQVVQTRRRRR